MPRCLLIAVLLAGLVPAGIARARCYYFSNATGICVCTEGDTWQDRQHARSVCKRIQQNHCGAIAKSTATCSTSLPKRQCYDQQGKKQDKLGPYGQKTPKR